jgi:hypothetical protein
VLSDGDPGTALATPKDISKGPVFAGQGIKLLANVLKSLGFGFELSYQADARALATTCRWQRLLRHISGWDNSNFHD